MTPPRTPRSREMPHVSEIAAATSSRRRLVRCVHLLLDPIASCLRGGAQARGSSSACFFCRGVRTGKAGDVPFVRDEIGRCRQYAEAVLDAALEIDRRGFFKVFRRAGYFANPKTKHDSLSDHLVVEDEIVRVLEQGKFFEKLSRKSPE